MNQNPKHQRHTSYFRDVKQRQKETEVKFIATKNYTKHELGFEFTLNWIITDMFSFRMLGLKLSDSTTVTASGVRTYIFHVAAQPPGFSAA